MGLLTLIAFFFGLRDSDPEEIALALPDPQRQQQAAPAVPAKPPILLKINAKGVVTGHSGKEDAKTFGTAEKMDAEALTKWIKEHPGAMVQINVDDAAIQGRVVEVLNVLTKLGIQNIAFVNLIE